MADIKDYTGKITSQHSNKPKYMAMVEGVAQCFVDTNEVAAGLPEDFDLDSALDAQLDDVGLWVGISRNIATPLTNVYFALDTPGLGFDQGAWKGPFDPDNGITTLDNETYRTLLRAKIGANRWDGTLEGSKAILDLVFNPDGHQPFFPVAANGEVFGTGDGAQTAFQLKYQGQNVYDYTSATIYRNDWQGNQQLYSTPRTNLFQRSAELENAYWGKNNNNVTVSALPSPDGLGFLRLMTCSANNSSSLVRSIPMAGTLYTESFFVQAGSVSTCALRFFDSIGEAARANFDLSSGTITAQGGAVFAGATIAAQGGGLYRITLSADYTSRVATGTNAYLYIRDTVSGVLGDSIYAWGGDFKDGPVSSYIPTTTSAVTVTDYVSGPFGQFTFATAPLPLATLSWTGQGTAYANGNYAFMVDNQDMTITIGVAGNPPSALQLALLTGGYITLKPQSVDVGYYISPTNTGPLFGFDASNQYIAGFDQGSWGKVYS